MEGNNAVCWLLVLAGVAWWLWSRYQKQQAEERRIRAINISGVDEMGGVAFERYVSRLFQHRGYGVQMTATSGDFGVDLVASRNGTRIAIQCKRRSGRVSRRAVSDAVAGRLHYRCNEAMVVTNSWFTSGAETLAKSTGCSLVDRDTLTTWILRFQGEEKKA